MLIGYCRCSTAEQRTDLQRAALEAAGCSKIFEDIVSGSVRSRPGLDACLEALVKGDTLVVWKLDRVARSIKHLIDVVEELGNRGIGFKSVTESIDTASAGGRLVMHIFGALAEFERALIRERVIAGLAAARAKGIIGGRRVTNDDAKMRRGAARARKGEDVRIVARDIGCGASSLYRWIARNDRIQEECC